MNYPRLFLLTSLAYALTGMLIGAWMHFERVYTMIPLHSHINALGWLSLACFGLIHRGFPELAADPLARWHFWLANFGVLFLTGGLWLFLVGGGTRLPLNAGVIVMPASFVLFLWLFWRRGALS